MRFSLLSPRVLIAPVLLLSATTGFSQAQFSINPTADAFVTTGPVGNDRSANNYGGAGALAIAASGNAQGEFQSLLKFNLAGTVAFFNSTYGAGQWTLQSITLQFTAQNPANPLFNASSAGSFNIIWQQNDSYAEGTGSPSAPTADGVTFSSLASLQSGADSSLGVFAFNGATTGTFVYTLLLPPGFTSDINAGGDVSLRLSAADTNVSYLFNSRNFGTVSARPLFTVTAIPEPSAFKFLAVGCGLLLVVKRKQFTPRCA